MSQNLPEIVLVLDNVRSLHNVGAILRTAEGFGVKEVIALGITPYTMQEGDARLPHVARRAQNQIAKTALGAEEIVNMRPMEADKALKDLKSKGFQLVALEQTADSVPIQHFSRPAKIALVLGNEPNGVSEEMLESCQTAVEIPMVGKKESFNVSAATAIALYALTL